MGKYFGTDGVRGIAGADLTCELAMKLGRGVAAVLTDGSGRKPRILIGKDTRQSGDMLEAALTAGLCSVGADVEALGVLPTPAVAYLVTKYKADAGVVISASHNPMEFNGIKVFASTGYKLPDEVEARIEAHIDNDCRDIPLATGAGVGQVSFRADGLRDYVDHLYEAIGGGPYTTARRNATPHRPPPPPKGARGFPGGSQRARGGTAQTFLARAHPPPEAPERENPRHPPPPRPAVIAVATLRYPAGLQQPDLVVPAQGAGGHPGQARQLLNGILHR